ncbi:MAG: hypothetical protein ACXWPM_09720, partial [Bdellovibrionota bacterium]
MRILLVLLLISVAAHAEEELGAPEPAPAPEQHHHHGGGPADCGGMSVFDITTGMCEPLPMKGMSMWHAMI